MSSSCLSNRLVRALCAVATVALISASPARAGQSTSQPSLAELARQEAARRKDIKDAKKVITTKDMPESARRPAAAAPAAADASAPQGGQPAGGQQQPPAGAAGNAAASEENGEAAWRGRITQARESLKRNEVLLDAVLMRVNGLTADYDRNSPFERATIGETRQKALEEAGRLKADIERTKKQIDDIEEAARKAGVPPGWLR